MVPSTLPQIVGLIIFAACVSINAAGLALDGALSAQSLPTITDVARRNPWVATIIILANVAGLVGLCLHFFEFRNGAR